MNDYSLIYSPIGGAGEIGMNMYAYGFKRQNKISYILVDAGVSFPKMDIEPGVDLIFPNPKIILNNLQHLEGIFITHAHEDHLGAIGFIASKIDCKIFCRKFTAEIVKDKLNKVNVSSKRVVIVKEWPFEVKLNNVTVAFFPTTHSVPEASFLIIKSEFGIALHTGDFKIDKSPVLDKPLDYKKLGSALGGRPSLCVVDSTNMLNENKGMSESLLKEPIHNIIKQSKGRIVFTSFASNLGRLKIIAEAGKNLGRSIAVFGRAMNNMLSKAKETGVFTDFPDLIDPRKAHLIPRESLLVIATGSQGEIRAASAQLSRGKYMGLEIEDGDTFVFSSKTIPGNEVAVNRVINNLSEKGVEVKYSDDREFHVSGHTNIPEMMDFYKKVKPLLVFPMHGEIRHLLGHKKALMEKNIKAEVVRNGEVVEIDKDLKIRKDPSDRPERLFVDGKIIAKSDNIAFKERIKMSSEGFLVIQIARRTLKQGLKIHFSSFGLPRFEDYLDELKTTTEKFLSNNTNKKDRYNLDELERFVKESIYSICGKKPIIKIAELE
mgnify:CR=1 FL=1